MIDHRLLAMAAASWLLLAPRPTPAQPPIQRAIPPADCRSTACLKGARSFAAGEYERAARQLEEGMWQEDRPEFDPAEYQSMLTLAAAARERAGEPLHAASYYERLSRLVDGGASFFAYRSLKAFLDGGSKKREMLESLVERGALEVDYPGSHLVGLRYRAATVSGLPKAERVERALTDGDRRAVCRWLGEQLQGDAEATALRNLAYGHCIPPDLSADQRQAIAPEAPTARAMINRAATLYTRVRYEKAVAQLGEVSWEELPTPLRCRGRFRLARSHYRLKHYSKAADIYADIVETCDTPETVDPRIRSLYALGRRHHLNDHFDKSDGYFETILEDYPERSHADDALMFLGRNARAQDEQEREQKLLERALADYPDGDMVHEFVWESIESDYRNGEYETVLSRLDALDLPPVDHQYFSQGRLTYIRAKSRWATDDKEGAVELFEEAWTSYPFSYYGYLAHLALRDRDRSVPALDGPTADAAPDWFFRGDWQGRLVRRLLDVGLDAMAAQLETGRVRARQASEAGVDQAGWWRLAYLHHRAGDAHQSHHIPRLRVPGRPWSQPEAGRTLRWQIAFPNPYEGLIEDAIVAESQQRSGVRLSPHLPTALMREESGFKADIVSWAGAVGLMQLMPYTARHHDSDVGGDVDVEALKQAPVNIRVGVDHLFLLADQFDSHPAVMIAAYNAGMGAVGGWLDGSLPDSVAMWVEDIPYRQTRHYVKRVIGSYAAYQWLNGRSRLDPAVDAALPDG